jgi:hypothetical protein
MYGVGLLYFINCLPVVFVLGSFSLPVLDPEWSESGQKKIHTSIDTGSTLLFFFDVFLNLKQNSSWYLKNITLFFWFVELREGDQYLCFFTSHNVYFFYHFASCAGYYSCTICLMVSTLRQSQTCHTMKPVKIYDKLKIICKHLVHGRQEDAHEFLRWVTVKLCRSFFFICFI